MRCIHAQAVANHRVYELTVEDPVPAFASVRSRAGVYLFQGADVVFYVYDGYSFETWLT